MAKTGQTYTSATRDIQSERFTEDDAAYKDQLHPTVINDRRGGSQVALPGPGRRRERPTTSSDPKESGMTQTDRLGSFLGDDRLCEEPGMDLRECRADVSTFGLRTPRSGRAP